VNESLVLWILAAVVAALLVLPLIQRRHRPPSRAEPIASGGGEEDPAAQALREIELDRAMGKLSERDYTALRTKYEAHLAARPQAPPSAAGGEPRRETDQSLEERAEALVRHWRERRVECPECGVRPEPEATYCSNCGRRLAPCPACGRQVTEPGARHCTHCGASLAA
jgi:hypothetical protein